VKYKCSPKVQPINVVKPFEAAMYTSAPSPATLFSKVLLMIIEGMLEYIAPPCVAELFLNTLD